MANPISFKPKAVDPKMELQRRLDAAPMEHAEALLVAYDLLEEAHRQGVLDALHGAIGAKNTIAGLIAKYAAEPVSVNAIRNVLVLGKMLGSIDPDGLTQEMEEEPPSLWQIFKRVRTPEARRALGVMTSMLGAMGRSAKR